jgi:tripartite-type tricarboxylate transporter receptor subunit TctC
MRRRAVLAGLATTLGSPVLAQPRWPDRPIRLVVPFVAGSSTDLIARVVAARLSELLGERMVVDNRAGAGGLIAAQTVARAAADGATLYFGGSTLLGNAALHRDPGYDPVADFTPIACIVENPALLVVRRGAPWRDAAGLAAAMRQRAAAGRPLTYGSGGVGTPAHLAAAALATLAQAEALHVPYRGANQAVLALEQGEVDFTYAIIGIALPLVRAGNFRPLMVTGARRATSLPEVPTFGEAIAGGPVVTTWSALVGPAGLPPPIQAVLHQGVQRAASEPAFVEALTRDGGEMLVSESPEAFARFWRDQRRVLAELVTMTGARVE